MTSHANILKARKSTTELPRSFYQLLLHVENTPPINSMLIQIDLCESFSLKRKFQFKLENAILINNRQWNEDTLLPPHNVPKAFPLTAKKPKTIIELFGRKCFSRFFFWFLRCSRGYFCEKNR